MGGSIAAPFASRQNLYNLNNPIPSFRPVIMIGDNLFKFVKKGIWGLRQSSPQTTRITSETCVNEFSSACSIIQFERTRRYYDSS